jgi:hypothetical protein
MNDGLFTDIFLFSSLYCGLFLGVLRFRIKKISEKGESTRSRLDALPPHVLGCIASNLDEHDLIDGLLSAYPDVGGKIRHSVPWTSIGCEDDFSSIKVLDMLRCLVLASVESTVDFILYWKPEDETTYRKWKRLLTSPHLRRVRVFDPRVLVGEKISNDVRTLKIMLPCDLNDDVVWSLFDRELFVPRNLEKVEVEAESYRSEDFPASLDTGGAEFYALFSAVPKLHFIVNPRPEFWDGVDAFNNLVELSFSYYRWLECMAPLDLFPNLRKLQLDCSLVRGRKFYDFDVVLPQLETLELTCVGRSGFRKNSGEIWEHLACLFPNLAILVIHVDARSYERFHPDVLTSTIPEQFTCLRKLKVLDVPLNLSDLQGMVDRFEAVRPGGVKEVVVDGIVKYPRPECHGVCAKFARWTKRKKGQNRGSVFDFQWEFPYVEPKGRFFWRPLVQQKESNYLFKFSQP